MEIKTKYNLGDTVSFYYNYLDVIVTGEIFAIRVKNGKVQYSLENDINTYDYISEDELTTNVKELEDSLKDIRLNKIKKQFNKDLTELIDAFIDSNKFYYEGKDIDVKEYVKELLKEFVENYKGSK